MDIFEIDFDGKNGINKLLNEHGTHSQDDMLKLIPFTTTKGKTGFNDFTGVVGSFSRLIDHKKVKLSFDMVDFFSKLNELLEHNEKECKDKLVNIVKELFIKNNELIPFNIKSMKYIPANNDNDKIAQFLYSMFVDKRIEEEYNQSYGNEDSNVLQRLVFDALPVLKEDDHKEMSKYECFLPYVQTVFQKDIIYLFTRPELYKKSLKRFLEYYFMFYVTQLAIKLSRFEKGDYEVEKIYMTLSWEIATKTRRSYEMGWKYVKEYIPQLFSHAITLEFLAHNNKKICLDYIRANDLFSKENDDTTAEMISKIVDKYKKWIPNVDYTKCIHKQDAIVTCKTVDELKKLFEIIDFQFLNSTTRKAAYRRYTARFIEFVHSNFGKRRGALGYTFNITEQDIILFTEIILGENKGRIRLVLLFDEFERRGLIFDRDSQREIVKLYEKLNLLEKKSDSGDAQYVKSIL